MHRNPQEKGVILLSQTLHNLSINFNQNSFTKVCIVSRLVNRACDSLCTDAPPPSGKVGIFPDGGGTSVHRLGMRLNKWYPRQQYCCCLAVV